MVDSLTHTPPNRRLELLKNLARLCEHSVKGRGERRPGKRFVDRTGLAAGYRRACALCIPFRSPEVWRCGVVVVERSFSPLPGPWDPVGSALYSGGSVQRLSGLAGERAAFKSRPRWTRESRRGRARERSGGGARA